MFVLLLRILLTRAVPDADVAGLEGFLCISGFLMVWKVCAIDLLVLVRALFRSSSRAHAHSHTQSSKWPLFKGYCSVRRR